MTPAEEKILAILRELKPHERIIIVKDQQGKPDHYFVERTQKVVITSTCRVINSKPTTETVV